MISTDPKLDAALNEFARLHRESPDVIDDVVRFLRERNHTATVTLRFHGGTLQAAELEKVSRRKDANRNGSTPPS